MSGALFPQALGAAWSALAPEIQRFHAGSGRHRGRADIDRGRGLGARVVAAAFGFPPAGRDVPVEVTVNATWDREHWTRSFGGRRFHSRITPAGPLSVYERFGPITFTLDLRVEEGGLRLLVRSGRIGPLPIPRALLPRADATERAAGGRFHFDIALEAPLIGRIVHYRGWLAPIEIAAEAPLVPQQEAG